MANIFDQFDSIEEPKEVNPFDQFDEPESPYAKGNPELGHVPTLDDLRASPGQIEGGSRPDRKAFVDSGIDPNVTEPAGGFAPGTDLPETKISMWDDYPSVEAAQKDYEKYANSPNSTISSLGEVVYNGAVVPRPEVSAKWNNELGVSNSTTQELGDAVKSAGKEMISLGLAGTDLVTGREDNKYFREQTPTMNTGGEFAPELLRSGTGFALGGSGASRLAVEGKALFEGGKAAESVAKIGTYLKDAWPRLSKLGSFVTKGSVAAAGGTAAVNPETDTLAVGDDKILGSLAEKLGMDPNSKDFNEAQFAKKADILADVVTTGALASGVFKGAEAAGSFAWKTFLAPALNLGSKTAKQDVFVEEILKLGSSLPDNASPEETRQAYSKVADLIRSNKDEVVDLSSVNMEDINVRLDTLTSLEKGLRASKTPEDLIAAERVRSAREGLSEVPEIKAKRIARGNTIDTFNDQLYEAGGGASGVETAGSNLVAGARNEIAGVQKQVDDVGTLIETNKTSFKAAAESDPTFGDAVRNLSGDLDPNIRAKLNGSKDEMIDTLVAVEGAQKKEMGRLAEELPEGIQMDPTWDEVAERGKQYLPGNLQEIAENGDFKEAHNRIIPWISQRMKALGQGPSPEKDELLAMRGNILGDQMETLEASADALDTQAKEAALAFRSYARETYYKNWGQGLLGDIKNLSRGSEIQEGAKRVFKDQAGQRIDSLISQGGRNEMETLSEVLQAPEAAGKENLITDIALGRFMANNAVAISKDGIEAVDVNSLIQSVADIMPILEKTNPAQAERIKSFIQRVQKQKTDVPVLEELFKQAQAKADEAEVSLFGTKHSGVSRLVEGPAGKRVELPNKQEAFEKMFKDVQSEEEITAMVERAKTEPETLEGLQAAFAKSIKYEKPADVIKNRDKIIKYSKIVYADKPAVTEATETLIKMIEDTNLPRRMSVNAGDAGNNLIKQGGMGLNRLITVFLGVLNPAATKARLLAGVYSNRVASPDSMAKMMGDIHANPDLFEKLAEKFTTQTSGKFTKEQKNAFRDFIVKGSMFRDKDRKANITNYMQRFDEIDKEQQTEEAISK